MKKILLNILFVVSTLAGIGLIAYPTVSDWWNQMHQSYAIADYMESMQNLEIDYELLKREAKEYNESLLQNEEHWKMDKQSRRRYQSLLNVTGNGIMGSLSIPKIEVALPIYHGTEESVLQIAIGHLEGSSLPVGGMSTHCVLSAHTGLPSAKLFTNLDQMEKGDLFTIQVLDEVLAYEVDQILVAEPNEMEYLEVEEGKDYCTLLTCTPYGINSHRLLVRGHRVEPPAEIEVEAMAPNKLSIGIILLCLCLVILGVIIIVRCVKKCKAREKKS